MKKFVFIALMTAFACGATAQEVSTDSTVVVADSSIVAAHFPGGKEKMDAYIAKQIEVQMVDKGGKGVHGEVTVSFNIDKKGYLWGAEVVKSTNAGLETAAINVVTAMPKWVPAKKNDEPVESSTQLVLKF
ncbi:MAG: TonB family protein [Prevotellaceae bacterium]|nr:TonB family protein [Candidatus Minthosoma caballi]